MAGIDDWDRATLSALHDGGAASAAELAERVSLDQFDEPTARAWVKDALGRGVVREVGGSGESTRYAITEKGSARIHRP